MRPVFCRLPPPSLFPIASLSAKLTDGTEVSLSEPARSQQYNTVLRGFPSLLSWCSELTARLHRPAGTYETLITNGSSHTLEMVLNLFLNPGDSFLVEQFHFPLTTEVFAPCRGFQPIAVAMDGEGILPDALEGTLAGLWSRGEALPKLLYTIPAGQNPTGASASPERRAALYEIARRYDLLIVEDDPYHMLRFPDGPDRLPGLSGLLPGYLSLDVDSRVVRVDTFSKCLAPGLRLGWVTAHPTAIAKLTMNVQAATTGPCSLTQGLVSDMLQAWGPQGFESFILNLQRVYAQRSQVLHDLCTLHLSDYAEWERPAGGMFLWMRLKGVDSALELWGDMRREGVVAVPGSTLSLKNSPPAPFLRLSFSQASDAEFEQFCLRLRRVLEARAGPALEQQVDKLQV